MTDQEQEVFELTFNRVFRGQTVDTKKIAECELIWREALEWERSKPCECKRKTKAVIESEKNL